MACFMDHPACRTCRGCAVRAIFTEPDLLHVMQTSACRTCLVLGVQIPWP